MFSLLSIPSAVCAMARYYQLIIFTGMKYQYQAGRPLLFSLSKWSENDIQSLDRYEYEGGRLEIFTKNMQYIDWIMDVCLKHRHNWNI